MTMNRTFLGLLAAVALIQTAALGKIVYDRHTLIKTGREITMQVIPVDPRDIMRGDYVRLGYGISPMRRSSLQGGASLDGASRGDAVYVTIRPGADLAWTPVAVATSYPKDVTTGDAVLKGRIQYIWDESSNADANLNVTFGIETYFVPEGSGKPIEEAVRDKKIQALVAVGSGGTAALKGLVIGGERHEDPPIF
jgi:uncharacterized membrane-anchored protein